MKMVESLLRNSPEEVNTTRFWAFNALKEATRPLSAD